MQYLWNFVMKELDDTILQPEIKRMIEQERQRIKMLQEARIAEACAPIMDRMPQLGVKSWLMATTILARGG